MFKCKFDRLSDSCKINETNSLNLCNSTMKHFIFLGSLQWNLALVWGPLTQLIVDFAVNDSTAFWAVFSEVSGVWV